MTYFGSGICSYTRRSRSRDWRVTGPVQIRMSAWRGLPCIFTPSRSRS
jgi:hypothetical protein